MKHLINRIHIHDQRIELHMQDVHHIHEYQLLLIQKEEHCLKLERTIENKAMLVCDISNFCSLSEYLKYVKLREQQFILLLINVFESIVSLQVNKIVYLDIRYIFIGNETGKLKFLCVPTCKDKGEEKDTYIRLLIRDILEKVQVDDACLLFGMLVQSLKNKYVQLPLLLQQLHKRVEIRKKLTLFEKYILKKEEPLEMVLPYPVHCIQSKRDHMNQMKNSSFSFHEKGIENAYLYDGEQYINLSRSKVIIGRSETCDVILEDTIVSKQHACIIWMNCKYYVKDLCSKNGTWLNSIKLESKNIYNILHKDILHIASYSFTFYYE